jgi:hypothetical protein
VIKRILFLIFSFWITAASFAATLTPFMDLNSARVMPKRISSVRYRGVFFRGTDHFSNSGESEPLSKLFDTKLSYRDLVAIDDPTADPAERGSLEGLLKAWNISLDENVGRVTGDISLGVSTMVPVVVHGITDRFTLAVALPIFNYKINVDSGFVASQNLERFAEKLKLEKKYYPLSELMKGINDPTGEAASRYKYKPLTNQEGQAMGDLVTVAKYGILLDAPSILAVQGEITWPTGTPKDIDKIVGFPAGDGQMDLGIGVLYDYFFTEDNSLNTSIRYTSELSDTSAERIPYKTKRKISPDIDENTSRNLGDHFHFQVGGQASPIKGVLAKAAYNVHYKFRDTFSGEKYPQYRYDFLSEDTKSSAHTYILSLSVSNIPWVRVSRNFLPLELNLNYLGFIAGENMVKNPILSLELATYF